jgi:hypothetical protein
MLEDIVSKGCTQITKDDFAKSQSIINRLINRLSYYLLSVGLKFIFMLQNPISNNEEDLVEG